MKLHTSLVTYVKNAAGRTVFEFPSGTVLDNILDDIWLIISYHYHRYDNCEMGIGHYHGIYEGYQIVTKEIIKNPIFKEQFIKSYRKVNGVVALDNIAHGILCGDDKRYFVIDGEIVSTFPSSKKFLIKGLKSKLNYLTGDWNVKHSIDPKEIDCRYNSDWDPADSNIALFIRCDYAKETGLVTEITDDEDD